MGEEAIKQLIAASDIRNMTIAEAKMWLKEFRVPAGSMSSQTLMKKYGKKDVKKYLTIVFALEIIEDQNVSYIPGENLLTLAVSRVPKSMASQAKTIQCYLKEWIGLFVTQVDYMSLTYDMALNIVKIRKALRILGETSSLNIPKACQGEQETLHILNSIE